MFYGDSYESCCTPLGKLAAPQDKLRNCLLSLQLSVFVLTRPCMLSTFNLILAFMTAVDTIFLVSSIIEYSIVQAFKLSSLEYDKLFVYFLYPTHNVTLVCSIYLHVVMAFERYLAVCHPELVYAGQPRRRGNHQINSEQESKTIRKKVKNQS